MRVVNTAKLCASLAVLLAYGSADITLNRPGCSDVAYIDDDKYVNCSLSPAERAGVEKCLNASSIAGSLTSSGARVSWCFNGDSFCTSNSSEGSSTVPSFDVLDNGAAIHIHSVSWDVPKDNIMSCSYISSRGDACSAPRAVNLTVYSQVQPQGHILVTKPEILLAFVPSSDRMAIVGRNYTLCFTINSKGSNGTAYWMVDGLRVNATDLTTPPDVNNFNFVALDCTKCSCIRTKYKGYLKSGVLSWDSRGYSAATFSLHTFTEGDVQLKRKLCYYEDTTLALLGVESVPATGDGVMLVDFFITDVDGRQGTGMLQVKTVYTQVINGGVLYSLNNTELKLELGEDAIVTCQATTAGNSSAMLRWSPVDHNGSLSQFSRDHWSQNLEEDLKDLCRDRSGIFELVVDPKLGHDVKLDQEGSLYLLHQAALIVCGADGSLSGGYECFLNNSTESHEFYLLVSGRSGQSSLTVPLLVVMGAAAVCLGVVVLVMCLWCCRRRSYKRSSLRMSRCHSHQHQQHPRGPSSTSRPAGVSAFNQSFFEDGLFDLEFSRDKLRLLSVLGEGQFGQVWKATAEGICPQDTSRSVVAVKSLKPNAGWSDKDDLQSELNIMLNIEPHPNIINFLGMCSETATEPLFILMEFALHGCLKDYLKKLATGKKVASHPLTPQSCSCSCHQPLPRDPLSQKPLLQRLHPKAVPMSSLDSWDQQNPEEAAHAAQLLSLLNSAIGPLDSGAGKQLDGLSHTSSNYAGRCAYHPCMHEQYQYQSEYQYQCGYQYHNENPGYYNRYYNHKEDPSESCSLTRPSPPPSRYVNMSDEDERSVGRVCTCSCKDRYTYNDNKDREENEYSNVSSTGCTYCCGPGREVWSPNRGGACTKCFCQDSNDDKKARQLGYYEFLNYAHQIARGMEHLENMQCVHRDLAARNVLIAENFLLKIGDFGLTRDLSGEDYYRKRSSGKIPARWMAVESLTEMKHTSKSDVWSYGVVLWEILTYGDLPYGKTPMASSIETLAGFLKSGHRLARPSACSPAIYEVMQRCWDSEPAVRPAFTQLADAFKLIQQKSPDVFNRNIAAVSKQPKVVNLESDIFLTLIPSKTSQREPGKGLHDLSDPPHPPAYNEALLMARSALSSTDSGCHMSEQDQYLKTGSLATPYYCHTSPPTEARDETVTSHEQQLPTITAATGLTEDDYLTLCRQEDRDVGKSEGISSEPSVQKDLGEGVAAPATSH